MANLNPFALGNPAADEEPIDAVVLMAAKMVRAQLETIPVDKRAAVIAQLSDLFEKPKTPQRGGAVLNNIIELFKREPRAEWSTAEVLAALADRGVNTDSKPVYNALTYLNGMRILRRVGYGRYIVEGGALLVTTEREG